MTNILLLEPDRVLAVAYQQALQHVGYEAVVCGTGQEAIDLLESFTADLIIMELQLAGHGGIEFLHELRSYPEWRRLTVIINTNLPPHALVPLRGVLSRDGGVSICLYKPRTSLQQLIRSVNDQVHRPS